MQYLYVEVFRLSIDSAADHSRGTNGTVEQPILEMPKVVRSSVSCHFRFGRNSRERNRFCRSLVVVGAIRTEGCTARYEDRTFF